MMVDLLLAASDVAYEQQPSALSGIAGATANFIPMLAGFGIFTMAGGIALCLLSIIRGPTLADRALAADVISIQLIGLVILLTIRSGSLLLIDGMLVLALLGFAGTIAAAQFIARPHVQKDLEAEEAAKADEEVLAQVREGDDDDEEDDLMRSVHGRTQSEDI